MKKFIVVVVVVIIMKDSGKGKEKGVTFNSISL